MIPLGSVCVVTVVALGDPVEQPSQSGEEVLVAGWLGEGRRKLRHRGELLAGEAGDAEERFTLC
jgi:hypothetical protein